MRFKFISALVLMLSAGAIGCAPDEPTVPAGALDTQSVVEASALSQRVLTAPDTVILDVRDAQAFAAQHVAGAVPVDIAEWRSATFTPDEDLSHSELWHAKIGAAGIDGNDTVYIYDDGRMTDAARAWFILQHFGVERAVVINGGWRTIYPRLTAGSIPDAHGSRAAEAETFEPTGMGAIALVDRQTLKQRVEEGSVQVLDVRTVAEFKGEDLRDNERGGHIPGAINIPHTDLLDANGNLKTRAQLAKVFSDAGVERGKPIVTHCDGGGRASLAAIAAARAGYGPVGNYYLSFGDWAADASCPVVLEEE